jgi:hypothetical protein
VHQKPLMLVTKPVFINISLHSTAIFLLLWVAKKQRYNFLCHKAFTNGIAL